MEHITVKFKNLSKSSINPVTPKDGIGSIQIIGSTKDIITSGTTRKIKTGLAIIIPEGYIGVMTLDPTIQATPWSLVLKNTIHPSESSEELVLEMINASPYPQKIVQKQALVRIALVADLKCQLEKIPVKPSISVRK